MKQQQQQNTKMKQTEFGFMKKMKRKRSYRSEKKRMIETIKDDENQLKFDYVYEL